MHRSVSSFLFNFFIIAPRCPCLTDLITCIICAHVGNYCVPNLVREGKERERYSSWVEVVCRYGTDDELGATEDIGRVVGCHCSSIIGGGAVRVSRVLMRRPCAPAPG
ncbi:hypothetical protein F4814DRAFT_430556 [Daldinia grandis]|nr:hypothetical protein F4814DRAFT_430556 [Daldinia grandis]